jgi:hypothetical protein
VTTHHASQVFHQIMHDVQIKYQVLLYGHQGDNLLG